MTLTPEVPDRVEAAARAAEKSLTSGKASVRVMAETLRAGLEAQKPRFRGPTTIDEDAAYIIAACAAAPALVAEIKALREGLLWIWMFAHVRSTDESKVFARVNRGALRTIAEKSRALLKEPGQ